MADKNLCSYCRQPLKTYKGLSENPSHWESYCPNTECKPITTRPPTPSNLHSWVTDWAKINPEQPARLHPMLNLIAAKKEDS